MRVFVYAVDGCDYGLTAGWDLKGLQQKRWGTYPALVNEKTQLPMSAQIWGSFLTGEVQDFCYWQETRGLYNNLVDMLPYDFARRLWDLLFRPLLGSKIVRFRTRDSLSGEPLHEKVKETLVINFPFVNYDPGPTLKLYMEPHFLGWKEEMAVQCERVESAIIEALQEDWQLLLTYEPLLDGTGHLFLSKEKGLVKEAYLKIDNIVSNFTKLLPEDTVMLILSDHGMLETGVHSEVGFYSLSEDIPFAPAGVTDFYPFILKLLEEER